MYYAKNPILPGFCPDPSICRVGEDYYLVNSSFAYFPGVPIFHSRDLANWEQIGNVLDRNSQLPLEGCGHSQGIFAPTIRYHEGTFYMITTNISAGGNFFVTSISPTGPWSEPHFLGPEAQGIDPSLFFDDDGKCYYVGTRPNQKGVRYNGDWEIWVQELDLEKKKLVGESKKIWKGALHHAIWPEGPHLYKKDGYYYLFHAEGGTGLEHAISVARSTSVFGPYEGSKKNPIFTHRHLGEDYPIVAAGHGDLVEAVDGNWYMVMLASRRLNGHGNMGRDTYLAKVTWKDGWPVINASVGMLEERVLLPGEGHDTGEMPAKFLFSQDSLPYGFMTLRNHKEPFYSLTEKKGVLRIFGGVDSICGQGAPSYLGVRQTDFYGEVSCKFSLEGEGATAGLVILCDDKTNLRLMLGKENNEPILSLIASKRGEDTVLASASVTGEVLEVRFVLNGSSADAYYRVGDEEFNLLKEEIDTTFLSLESTGGFTGCTIGMYVHKEEEEQIAYADFIHFIYTHTFS